VGASPRGPAGSLLIFLGVLSFLRVRFLVCLFMGLVRVVGVSTVYALGWAGRRRIKAR
jgi:hypothetical protein